MKNGYRIEQKKNGTYQLFLITGQGYEIWLATRPTKEELAALLVGR